LSRVSIKVFVASPHDEDTVTRLWNETLERLPLVRTFRHGLDLRLELKLIG
jgi:hypothetical protein